MSREKVWKQSIDTGPDGKTILQFPGDKFVVFSDMYCYHYSVHLSVCHTAYSYLNGSHLICCVPHNKVVFLIFWGHIGKFRSQEFRGSPQMRELTRDTPPKGKFDQYAAITRKWYDIGHKLLLFSNRAFNWYQNWWSCRPNGRHYAAMCYFTQHGSFQSQLCQIRWS